MNEIIADYLKGFYPYFAIPALAGMIYLIKKRRWQKEHSLLLAIYILAYLLVPLQVYIADRSWAVPRRYLLPYAPVLFGFAALLWQRAARRIPRMITVAAGVLAGCFLLCDTLNPVMKDYVSNERRLRNAEIRAMASLLNRQLASTPRAAAKPMWYYEPRLPGRAVIKDAPPYLIYLSGCELFNPYFPAEKYDYLVISPEQSVPAEDCVEIFSGTNYKLLQVKIPEK